MNRKEWLIGGLALATRIPFTSRTLYDFDCVAFARGLDRFDASRFQPHPPGYLLYILAGRLAKLVWHDDNAALVVLSVGATTLAAIAVYRIGRVVLSETAGLAAALMLLSSPLFWTYGAVAAPYAFGALAAAGIALLCLHEPESADVGIPLWIGLAVGLASGFRPDVPIVLGPLAVVSSWKHGRRGLTLLAVGAFCGLLLWLAPTILASNGWRAYRTALAFQSRTIAFSNAATGLTRPAFIALNATKLALYLAWAMGPVGAVLLLGGFGRAVIGRDGRTRVLLVWCLPYVLLVTLVAFGQPGMMLTALPAFFLLAASALPTRTLPRVAGAVILTNALLFVAAPGTSRAAFDECGASVAAKVRTELRLFSARGIRLMDRFHSSVMGAIRREYRPNETVVFTNLAAWPHAAYALPGYSVQDFFAFSGFGKPYPDPDIHLPAGRFPLPSGTRHVILLDGNRHSPALWDCVVEHDRTGIGRPVPGVPPEFASHVREIPVDDGTAMAIGEGGEITLEPTHGR